MLDREKRAMVMELFSDGVGVSEIARKVGVSRQSVYRVIQSDFEQDAEIHTLKKRLKKAELREKIRDVRKPLRMRNELTVMKDVIDGLISRVLVLWYLNPKMGNIPPECFYCGEKLECVEVREGGAVPGYRCNRCGKVFPFP